MQYLSPPRSPPDADRIGVLLVNTGTPDSLEIAEVRRYLAAFLGDPRVIEAPRLPWLLALHGYILRTRPRVSAAKYRRIWTDEGSPLLTLSRQLQSALTQALSKTPTEALTPALHDDAGGSANAPVVEIAMLYSRPSVPQALQRLAETGCHRILVLPLYPQYCGASAGAAHDQVSRELSRWRWLPELRWINSYHDHPGYIEALRRRVLTHWERQGRPAHVLLSFHGIPRSYVDRGDPYERHCRETARLLTDALELPADAWSLTFQSRVGRATWLHPYTVETVSQMPARGIQDLGVICPGFALDCLETLEEIDMENHRTFLAAGGARFSYVPALNASAEHTVLLASLIHRHCQGWFAQT